MIFLGKMRQLREQAKKDLVSYGMHSPKEELEKEMNNEKKKEDERRKAEKALVMKDIGNHIVKNGNIHRGLLTRKLLGTMGEEELRRTNIFAYHHSSDSYTFATRALKTVYQVACVTLVSVLILILLYYCCLGDCERQRGSSKMRDRRDQHGQFLMLVC